MTTFRFFQDGSRRHLRFSKGGNFRSEKDQESQSASPSQISVKLLLRYGNFSIFPRLRPSAILHLWWACLEHYKTTVSIPTRVIKTTKCPSWVLAISVCDVFWANKCWFWWLAVGTESSAAAMVLEPDRVFGQFYCVGKVQDVFLQCRVSSRFTVRRKAIGTVL